MAFRLRKIEPKERDVRRAIHQLLERLIQTRKVKSFLCPNGGASVDRFGRPVSHYRLWWGIHRDKSKDFPDIVVFMADGTAVFLEVKRPGRKPTPGQKAFLDYHADQYRGGVVYSVEDALAIMEI